MAASYGGAMFLKSVDASGNIKDGEYVANIFLSAIEEVGEENVVQIVTDNGSNFKATGLMIEAKHPHIFWTSCVVRCLNLALKSMCNPSEKYPHQYANCKWITGLINDVQNIRNFIVNHGMILSLFNNYSELSLLKVVDTRFATSIIMTKRLREVKNALEKMVMDANWKAYTGEEKTSIELKAQEAKQCTVDDDWWDNVNYFLQFTEPIIDMLRFADTDAPILHLVYDMWDTMIEKVKMVIFKHEKKDLLVDEFEFFNVICDILISRWNRSNTPLNCMAHSLVPKYYSDAWLQGGSNGTQRQAPYEDEEVSKNRRKCLQRYFTNPDDLHKVYMEYGAFSSGLGYFNEPHVIEARTYEEPLCWWANHGATTPLLQGLAFKLLSQPASSSCCERNWSTYSLIQDIKRNKLATDRAEDLMFVHCNICLLSRKKKSYKEGPSKYWDVGGDKFNIEESTFTELEDLSLDDPQLESVSFLEEDLDED